MTKYFYIENEKQFGPFTVEELSNHNIEKTTPVWHDQLTDWTTAGALQELAFLFKEKASEATTVVETLTTSQATNVVPQPTTNTNQGQPQTGGRTYPPKTWLVESILVTLFCCMPFGIAGIVFASKVESLFYSGDIEGAERASRDAAKWTKIGFWIAAGFAILYILIVLLQLLFIGGSMLTFINDIN